jgi:hypothetical protein
MAQSYDIGGPVLGPVRDDPRREYVMAGPYDVVGRAGMAGFLFAQVVDDVVRRYGPRVYELMTYDPAVDCAIGLLKAGALAEGIRLTVPEELSIRPGEVVSRRKQQQELELAAEVLEYCERGIARLALLDRPAVETLDEMLDALPFGCELAEVVWELMEEGPDQGRLQLRRFQPKPRWSWAFRVTRTMEVPALRVWTGQGWEDVARDHFALLSWRPRKGDPRGSSLLRAAYMPWNLKLQTYPDLGEYLKKFASASLVLEASADARPQTIKDQAGATREVPVPELMARALVDYKQHSVIGLPPGISAKIIQAVGNGEAFGQAHDRVDRDIFRTVILATRPIMESRFGSRADSESGMDLFGIAVKRVREPLGLMFKKDVLARGVELNWGRAIAERYTPDVSFGVSEHMSPDLLSAFAGAWQKGLFEPFHKPWIWSKLGAPAPPTGIEPTPPPGTVAGGGADAGGADAGGADMGGAGGGGAGENPGSGNGPGRRTPVSPAVRAARYRGDGLQDSRNGKVGRAAEDA